MNFGSARMKMWKPRSGSKRRLISVTNGREPSITLPLPSVSFGLGWRFTTSVSTPSWMMWVFGPEDFGQQRGLERRRRDDRLGLGEGQRHAGILGVKHMRILGAGRAEFGVEADIAADAAIVEFGIGDLPRLGKISRI